VSPLTQGLRYRAACDNNNNWSDSHAERQLAVSQYKSSDATKGSC